MRVVADTNVYVSALVFGGKPQAILDQAQEGWIELFISDEILEEITRVLREKFHRTPDELQSDTTALEAITTRVRPVERVKVIQDDPTDNVILEAAVAADAEIIISGDRHILALGSFRGIPMMRVAEFLETHRER